MAKTNKLLLAVASAALVSSTIAACASDDPKMVPEMHRSGDPIVPDTPEDTGAVGQRLTIQQFVNRTAQIDLFDKEAGELAEDKSEDSDVTSYGDDAADFADTLQDDLNDAAEETETGPVPAVLNASYAAEIDGLRTLSGQAFDLAYMQREVQLQRERVVLFQSYASSGENEEMREFAKDHLNGVKEQLEEATETLNEISSES